MSETIRGAVVVTIARRRKGYYVTWRAPLPHAVWLPEADTARALVDRLAAGEPAIEALSGVLGAERRSDSARVAGAASWTKYTPAERSARARANALVRWRGRPKAKGGARDAR